jgi:hypothetical protein
VSSITIISDAPNCGVTYDHHNDDRNSFITQATDVQKTLNPTQLYTLVSPVLNVKMIFNWMAVCEAGNASNLHQNLKNFR